MIDPQPAPAAQSEGDPVPVLSGSGVDLSLIRWMLSLTARERLAVLQAQANSMAKLRDAYAGR